MLPLIMAGSSLLGGYLSSRAASRAARTQAAAAQRVSDETGQIAGEYGGYIAGASEGAASGVENATNTAVGRIDQGTADANALLRGQFDQSTAALNPYMEAGRRGTDALAGMLDPSQAFQFSQDDPSYQFRMAEGQKALERSAAARGGAFGGAAMKAMTRFGQDFASTEYQKAFDRYMSERQQRAGIAGTLSGQGLQATGQYVQAGQQFAGQSSDNITRGAQVGGALQVQGASDAGRFRLGGAVDVGNLMMGAQGIKANAQMGGANATASGIVGSANAWGNAFNGTSNSILTGALLNQGGGFGAPQPGMTYSAQGPNGPGWYRGA